MLPTVSQNSRREVFYNYIARCFFLVDLKVGTITSEDIGQMQLYKHYYEREMMNPGDNPPVGIVLWVMRVSRSRHVWLVVGTAH